MNLLFCNDPFDSKAVDPDFEDEFVIAQTNGFLNHLCSFEVLTKDKDAASAIRKIKPADSLQKVIYRGWMLKPVDYASLYNALLLKNYQLVNTPREYQNCHYLPDSYPFIKSYTPKTIWIRLENAQIKFEDVFDAIEIFGDAPLIVKDYVKSQKHYWDTACYIPKASDKERATSVIERFLELQGDDLNEGIVLREFIDLADLTTHSKSGMPLKQEYRLFYLNGNLVGCYNYWEEGDYPLAAQPPLDFFIQIAQSIESNFFTLDIAKTKRGEWIIIETGDGQVAGIPESADKQQFYNTLKENF